MHTSICVMAILHTLNAVEGRVHCQDAHASSWIPFGYSCPVLCQNIVNAIQRLKIMDFENIIYPNPVMIPTNVARRKPTDENALNEIETAESDKDNRLLKGNDYRKRNDNFKNRINSTEYKTNFHTNLTMDKNKFYKDVLKLTQLAAKTFKGGCKMSKKRGLVDMMKCARKSNFDGSFLKIMTKLLNKYANSEYKFTEDMTEVLLEKIFGENTDLRNNIFDVNKLLGYLRQALHAHKEHENRDVIVLGSKQCLTLSLPGCFCKTGFVENSGQCVRPSDCVEEFIYDEYLARVVVN